MQKNQFILIAIDLKSRLYMQLHQVNFQVLTWSVILIAAFQLPGFNVEASPDINEELNFSGQTSETLPGENVRELKPGETIERQIEASETQSYSVKVEADHAIIVTIPKHSIALSVRTFTSNGEQLAYHQRPAEAIIEPIVILAEKAGDYRINVRAYWSGTYSISADIPHKITEKDKKYFAAQKLYLEFVKSSNEPSEWIQKLEGRLALYRDLGEPELVAIALFDLAFIYYLNAEYLKATNCKKEALEILRPIDKATVNIFSLLNQLANDATQRKGDYQTAIDYLNQALSLSRSRSYKNGEASAFHHLGVVYHLLADEQKALDFYEQSLAVRRSINPSTLDSVMGEALTLNNIGNLYRGNGGYEKVLEYFGIRTVDDRKKAIDYYLLALEVYQSTKNVKGFFGGHLGEANMLLKIGNTYKELGNYSESLNYIDKSLALFKDVKYDTGEVNVLRSIGNLYLLNGNHQKSFEYYEQTISLLKTGADDQNQAEFLNGIAKDYYRIGKTQKALELLNEALSLSQVREQQIVTAASLFEIARIERDLGNFNNARNRIEEGLQTVELLRAKISSLEMRATFLATVKRYYDFYIDLLMQAHKSQPEKGFDLLALQMSEKARSRSLLDLLSLARIDINQGVDLTLLERERSIQERLIEKANQQTRLLLRKHTEEEATKIKREVAALTDEYQAVQTDIRNKSPRYAALTQPTSLNAKQIQQLLDSGTVLLEYSLGDKKSYLWAVTSDSVTSFDLPKREEIATQARKVYDLLTARNQHSKDETGAPRLARIKAAEKEYPKAAAKLSQMLLGPIASHIGNKRLLIVPDGALNYIPFSALPSPKDIESINLWQPLGINHEIVTLPSASILALLREETQDRKPAPKMLAVFADPVFNQNDIRSKPITAGRNRTNSKQNGETLQSNYKIEKSVFNRDFERAVSDVGLVSEESTGLPRLPFSRREADSIFKVSPKNLSLKQVDFDASKTAVFSSDLEQYRILHFASHGLLNSQHPELSGIVLSLVDRKGAEIDGFLRLQDIYNLELSADLVVLSACNTALGKDVKGEGLIGLTRGFMYAGAPRVVASLWKVDDTATAEFMSIFYRKMLVENLRPAAALRAAQTEMMKQTRWKSPYYWAPFIIQGEWR